MSHVTLAASEGTFVRLFERVRDEFVFAKSGSGNFGPFSAGYNVAAHLEGGTVDLRADDTVSVGEIEVKWDLLDVWIGIDIPEICIGGSAFSRPRSAVLSAPPRSASSAAIPTSP